MKRDNLTRERSARQVVAQRARENASNVGSHVCVGVFVCGGEREREYMVDERERKRDLE